MAQALVDTTVLYAAANRRAARHSTALDIVRAADTGILPELVISDAMLVETMNGLTRDIGSEITIDFLSRLQSGEHFEIRREPTLVWNTALDTFERVDRLSLADAMLDTTVSNTVTASTTTSMASTISPAS